MKLGEATAQLENAMKENACFDLPTPNNVANFDSLRFDGWSRDQGRKTLECPVCRNSFNLNVRVQVIPGRKAISILRSFGQGCRKDITGMILTSSEECEKIPQLRLNRMEEQKVREYEELNESRKLQKAGLKLANLEKVPTTLPENNRPVARATARGAAGVQTVPKPKMTPVTHHQP